MKSSACFSSSQFLQKHVEGTQLPAFPKTPFLSSCQRSCEFVGTGQCLSNVLSVLVEVGLIARNVLDKSCLSRDNKA